MAKTETTSSCSTTNRPDLKYKKKEKNRSTYREVRLKINVQTTVERKINFVANEET